MNIMHSSRTDRWFTPIPIIERVKKVLGPIDLDPASEPLANERVGAGEYYTEDGQNLKWFGTMFINPPGGKTGNQSNTAIFWKKLMQSRNKIQHAIFLAFSLEALQTTQGKGVPSIGEFPFCVPARRIRFDTPFGPSKAPSHSNVIVYVPGQRDTSDLFRQVFVELGVVT